VIFLRKARGSRATNCSFLSILSFILTEVQLSCFDTRESVNGLKKEWKGRNLLDPVGESTDLCLFRKNHQDIQNLIYFFHAIQ